MVIIRVDFKNRKIICQENKGLMLDHNPFFFCFDLPDNGLIRLQNKQLYITCRNIPYPITCQQYDVLSVQFEQYIYDWGNIHTRAIDGRRGIVGISPIRLAPRATIKP
jgi:hypothetical protein